MITVTKKFSFCYSHKLPGYDGRCRNLHGHNSEVEVEVGPDPNNDVYGGMIMDFGDIKEIAGGIIDDLDHQHLNDHENFKYFCSVIAKDPNNPASSFNKIIPTAEIMCQYLVFHISKRIPGLTRLRVSETPDSWAEWRA